MTETSQSPAPEESGNPNATSTGATAQDPNIQDGQAGNGDGTTQQGTRTPEESFFDPSALPEELKAQYKNMQAAFTKKMQGLSTEKQKVEAYNAFMSDPMTNLQKLAQQYGYAITPPNAQPRQANQFEPQSWDEVFDHFAQRIEQKFKPVIESVQKVTASNIEKQLAEIDPQWQIYEDDMKATLRQHPTLVNDVSQLYRMSVPEEVLTSRAVAQALKRVEEKTKAAQVHGSRGATKSATVPKKANSFQEAVEMAKESLNWPQR